MVTPGWPQFDVPDIGERQVDVTSDVAHVLIGVRPANPDDPNDRGLICRKLWLWATASMAERLAKMKPGRRVCAW